MTKTLTKIDIVELAYKQTGIPRKIIKSVVDDILEKVCQSLENGENVKLSSFGTFKTREKKTRLGRNPKTGEEVMISAKRVLTFKVSSLLKQSVES